MEQRVSVVTLGVADLARARAFYEALGWSSGTDPALDVVFFQAGDMVLALWGRDHLAADSGVADGGGWGGVTLAHNVSSPAEVDRVLAGVPLAGRKVLDFGCGAGGITLHIAKTHGPAEIVGYDVEQPVIVWARESAMAAGLSSVARFVSSPPGRLPFEDGAFDVIFSKDAMIHVPDKEALFNQVYDEEHVPLISKVPGVISVTRARLDTLRMTMGGETKVMDPQGAPRYAAIYELESPEVLTSPAFAKAVDQGRWPTQVRPYTRKRRHVLYRRLP